MTEPRSATRTPGPDPQPPDPRRWLALAVVVTAQFMIVLDAAIVYIALPQAQQDLGISTADRQWVVTAYTVTFGGLLLLGGRVGDLLGRKPTLVVGLVGFAAASALGGVAPTAGLLFTARALQGLFAAALAPTVLALISVTFVEAHERAKAFALYGALSGSGAAAGLLLGGVLTEYASWRWCLLATVPVALVAAVGAAAVVRDRRTPSAAGYDVAGALTVTLGLVSLVYGLTRGGTGSWSAPGTVVPLLAGGTLLLLFAAVEARHRAPLLPPRILRDAQRTALYASALAGNAAQLAATLFLTYHFQSTLGWSALSTGLAFLPFTAGVIVGADLMGRLMPRTGAKPLMLVGSALGAGALTVLALAGVRTTFTPVVLPALVVLGLGVALSLMPVNSQVLVGVQERDTGVASALINSAQQVGGALGTALVNTVFVLATGVGGAVVAVASDVSIDGTRVAFGCCAAFFAASFAVVAAVVRPAPADQPSTDTPAYFRPPGSGPSGRS